MSTEVVRKLQGPTRHTALLTVNQGTRAASDEWVPAISGEEQLEVLMILVYRTQHLHFSSHNGHVRMSDQVSAGALSDQVLCP